MKCFKHRCILRRCSCGLYFRSEERFSVGLYLWVQQAMVCFGGWIHCFSRWRSAVIHILGDRLWDWFVVQCVSRDYWSATAWHTDAVLRSLSLRDHLFKTDPCSSLDYSEVGIRQPVYWDAPLEYLKKKHFDASKSSERDCKINPYELSGLSQLVWRDLIALYEEKYNLGFFTYKQCTINTIHHVLHSTFQLLQELMRLVLPHQAFMVKLLLCSLINVNMWINS